jgi:hypothetical protein
MLNISPAICVGPPAPDDAKLSCPGFARASAITSWRVRAGMPGLITITCGATAMPAIGAKSRTGSYGVLIMLDKMACVLAINMIV